MYNLLKQLKNCRMRISLKKGSQEWTLHKRWHGKAGVSLSSWHWTFSAGMQTAQHFLFNILQHQEGTRRSLCTCCYACELSLCKTDASLWLMISPSSQLEAPMNFNINHPVHQMCCQHSSSNFMICLQRQMEIKHIHGALTEWAEPVRYSASQ